MLIYDFLLNAKETCFYGRSLFVKEIILTTTGMSMLL